MTLTTGQAPLAILHHDAWLVAIDKPSGVAVHRSAQVHDRAPALQRLRDQLGQWVYPVHRLDRATSGVLLFALDPTTATAVGTALADHQVDKRYLAITRGWIRQSQVLDYPLRSAPDKPLQQARTAIERLATTELPIPIGRYRCARYSLVDLHPHTGRHHQLRKHLAHLRHPIVGDVRHGEGRHNRLFREHFGISRLLLHAYRLELRHPVTGRSLCIESQPDEQFTTLLGRLGWQ